MYTTQNSSVHNWFKRILLLFRGPHFFHKNFSIQSSTDRSTRFLCIGTFSMMIKFSILPSKFFMSPYNDFIDFSLKLLLYTKFQMFTFQFPSSIEDLITRQIIIIQSKVINCIIKYKKIFSMWSNQKLF